jgi:hypothetical protein
MSPRAGTAQGTTLRKVAWALAIATGLFGVAALTAYLMLRTDWLKLPGSFAERPTQNSTDVGTVIFSGRADALRAAPGNAVEQDRSDSSVSWIRSSLRAARSNGATDGVAIEIAPSLQPKGETRRVRVTVSAKRAAGAPSSPFALAYSTGSAGNSGWLVFEASDDFKDYSFNFVIPRNAATLTHFVGIWSDISGRGIPLAVRGATIAPAL